MHSTPPIEVQYRNNVSVDETSLHAFHNNMKNGIRYPAATINRRLKKSG